MPVLYEHAPLPKQRHEVRRHQIAAPIHAGFTAIGIQLFEPGANRDGRADHQHYVGVPAVCPNGDLAADRPHRLELLEEEAVLAPLVSPVAQEVKRGPGGSGIALLAPRLDALANHADEEQLDLDPDIVAPTLGAVLRVAVVVDRLAPPGDPL